MFVLDICQRLKEENIPYALVGGFTVAIHGAIRGTLDVEIITELSEDNLAYLKHSLNNLGLTAKVPVTITEIVHQRKNCEKKKILSHGVFKTFMNGIKLSILF